MANQNFTPIADLTKKQPRPSPISKPKEVEPIPSIPKEYEVKEVIEHQPEEEVKPYLQPRAETIELPPDLKKMGLQPATNTQFPSYQNVKLPVSDDKVLSGLNAPITSSLRWLATLAIYILRKAHLTLKVVKGHVVRIIKP